MPWAWLLVTARPDDPEVPIKDIENRGWSTQVRGPVMIHASKTFDTKGTEWIWENYERLGLNKWMCGQLTWLLTAWRNMKTGLIIGQADITDCVSESSSPWFRGPYGFVLRRPVVYGDFRQVSGKLRFFKPGIR